MFGVVSGGLSRVYHEICPLLEKNIMLGPTLFVLWRVPLKGFQLVGLRRSVIDLSPRFVQSINITKNSDSFKASLQVIPNL